MVMHDDDEMGRRRKVLFLPLCASSHSFLFISRLVDMIIINDFEGFLYLSDSFSKILHEGGVKVKKDDCMRCLMLFLNDENGNGVEGDGTVWAWHGWSSL